MGSVPIILLFAFTGFVPRVASAQSDTPITLGYAHGTAGFVGLITAKEMVDAPETVVVFTSAAGVRLFALADRKGDYRIPLEPGQYCVSAYDSRGYPLQLSPQQLECINVSDKRDVRLDVMISRATVAGDVSQSTIELAEIEAQVLAGSIVDGSRSPIPDVLIEQLSPDGKRVEAVLTNSKGRFAMKPRAPWTYAMRVSKPGFDTLLFKVRV